VVGRKLCLLALGIFLLAGCGSGENAGDEPGQGNEEGITRQISGRWIGKLHQKGLAPFEIAVDIGADGTGQVAYTGIQCGGEWVLDEAQPSTPPRYRFTEEINEGAGGTCKGTGTVSLSPIQGHSPNRPAYGRLNYRFAGGGVTSRGLLHRTDPAGLARVFQRAGLTPP
jgi:hypothetical protein